MVYTQQSIQRETLSPHKAKVILTKELVAQIAYLHHKCPKNTEWSGLLVWELTKGSIENLEELEIKCHAVFPMDFGDATFTSFEGNDNWIKAFTQFPQIDPIAPQPNWYVGKQHTHHNMSCWHSGTDDGDIHENASKMPMFLSLIVNYACETDCKLAIAIETEETVLTYSKWRLKGWKDKKKEFKKTKTTPKSVYIIKCEVEYEQDAWFKEQTASLVKPPVTFTNYYNKQLPTTVVDKKPYHKSNPQLYKRMINNLAELLTLGTCTNMVAYQVLQKLDADLNMSDVANWRKAVKYYFMEVWIAENFFNLDCGEEEVLQELESFMEYHSTMWIYKQIKLIIDELKTECAELWAVQGSTLV